MSSSLPLSLRIAGIQPWKIFLALTVLLNLVVVLALFTLPTYRSEATAFGVLTTLCLYLLYRFVFSASYFHHWQLIGIVYGTSWKVYLLALMILLGGISSFHLFVYLPAWMNWSWTAQLLDLQGSLLFLPAQAVSDHAGWSAYFLMMVFWFSLLLLLPEFAYLEEKSFRYGKTAWLSIVFNSIVFGLLHFIFAGIPFTMTLYLILLGFCFALFYRYHYRTSCQRSVGEELSHQLALKMSTRLHTLHNALIVSGGTLFYFLQSL